MRNLALAAFIIVIFEPEALMGASFQLSFAAVAALVAVWETRAAAAKQIRAMAEMPMKPRVDRNDRLLMFLERTRHGPAAMLLSTVSATAATASFMANGFCAAFSQINDASQVICKVVFIHSFNIMQEHRFSSSFIKTIYTCLMLKG